MVDKNELSALEEKTEDERPYDSLVGYVEARYERARTHEDTLMKNDGYRHIKTIVVYMGLTYSSQKQKSLAYLLK